MLEKMSHFFDFEHNGSIDDMYVDVDISKEKIETIQTMHPYRLNFK